MGHSNGFLLSVAIVIAVGCDGAVLHDAVVIAGGLDPARSPPAHGLLEKAAADELGVLRR